MSALGDLMLADAPELLWPLDEASGAVATDLSGNGNHGTYFGSPTFGLSGPRWCQAADGDGAVRFDGEGAGPGSAQFVGIAPSPVSGTGPMAWEVWCRSEGDTFTRPGREYANLIQQRILTPPTNYAGMLRVFSTTGAIGDPAGFGLRLDDPLRILGPLDPFIDRAGCWNHVAITRDASDVWRLYLNAELVGSYSYGISITSDRLSFGADWTDVDRNHTPVAEQELWRGRMAYAAAYYRNLTAADIAARWALGCTGCGARRPTVGGVGFGL